MPSGPLQLRRRAALTLGVAGVLALAGCDDDDRSPGATSAPSGDDPDSALVRRVLRELRAAERATSGAGMLELATLHRAHLEALGATPPGGRAGGGSVDRDTVLQRERALQGHLVAAAVEAESGALARLLASMSAAVGQRLASPGGTP